MGWQDAPIVDQGPIIGWTGGGQERQPIYQNPNVMTGYQGVGQERAPVYQPLDVVKESNPQWYNLPEVQGRQDAVQAKNLAAQAAMPMGSTDWNTWADYIKNWWGPGAVVGASEQGFFDRFNMNEQQKNDLGGYIAARQREMDKDGLFGSDSFEMSLQDVGFTALAALLFGPAAGAGTAGGTGASAGGTAAEGTSAGVSAGAGAEFTGGFTGTAAGSPGFSGTVSGSPGLSTSSVGAGSAGALSPGFFPSESVSIGAPAGFDPTLVDFSGGGETFLQQAFPDTQFTGGFTGNVTGSPGFSGNVQGSPGLNAPIGDTGPSMWDRFMNLDWKKKLLLGKLGLQGYSMIAAQQNARAMQQLAKQAQNQEPQIIDPLGYGPRAEHLARLTALSRDPSLLEQSPGYDAAMRGVERRMASQGYLGSGNMMRALAKSSGDFYNQEIARLNTLAGGNMPLTALRPDMTAAIAALNARASMRGAGLATAGFGLASLGELFS